MRIEEAIKFAEHAQTMTDIPEVKEFYAMAEKALRIQNQVNWISVKDRLPEEYTRVLTYSHADGVMIGGMDCDGEFYFPYCLLPDEPTHWMPLPEPPERDDE